MANEAVVIELGPLGGNPVRRTCASGTAITKGTLMALNDPNTAIAASTLGQIFAGIAAADKSASDFATTIPCWTAGVFDITGAGAGVGVGKLVVMSGANGVTPAIAGDLLSGGSIVGVAEEAGTTTEVIRVRLKGY